MNELFGQLTQSIETHSVFALPAAFIWGILSVILSPCHLASVPLIVGFINGQGRMSSRRAFLISSIFAFGILLTIGLVGLITGLLGGLMGDIGAWANYFVAAILFIVGLHLLGVFPMPFSGPGQVGMKRKGLLAAFILGLVFGIALGPCTFAYMAPVLAVAFSGLGGGHLFGALLILVYGVGHCAVIAAAGGSAEMVQRYLNWNEESRGANVVKSICGVFVLLGGVWLVYIA